MGPKIISGQKKMLVLKKLGKKKLGFEKILDSKKNIGTTKKIWPKKTFESEKMLGPKFSLLFLFFL